MIESASQATRIRYDEGCLAAHALNLVGDRWALLTVRELIFTPKRFQMIRAGLPGISASVLTARLAQLRDAGVVHHDERLGIYSLTAAGKGLLPVLEALCRWALTIPGHDPSRFISPTALMISMGVNLQRARTVECTGPAGFDFGQEAFETRIEGGRLVTRAVAKPDAAFTLSGSGNAMAAAVYGNTPIAMLAARRIISAQGDIAEAQRFIDQFRLAPQDQDVHPHP